MTSRERVLTAIAHHEPDRVPLDLAGTHVTGISRGAYERVRAYLEMPADSPRWQDVIQQTVIPGDDFLDHFGVDTRGLFPLTSHNGGFEQLEDGEMSGLIR